MLEPFVLKGRSCKFGLIYCRLIISLASIIRFDFSNTTVSYNIYLFCFRRFGIFNRTPISALIYAWTVLSSEKENVHVFIDIWWTQFMSTPACDWTPLTVSLISFYVHDYSQNCFFFSESLGLISIKKSSIASPHPGLINMCKHKPVPIMIRTPYLGATTN